MPSESNEDTDASFRLDRFQLDSQVVVVTGAGPGHRSGHCPSARCSWCRRRAWRPTRPRGRCRRRRDRGARPTGRRGASRRGTEAGNELLATTAQDHFGRLDAWVSNARGSDERVMRHLAETPRSAWEEQIELNLTAPFLGARAALAHLTPGGSILTISSIAGRKPSVNNGPYGAAKAAIDHFTATLAAEQAPRRIRVNAVAPGPVPTEVFMAALQVTAAQLPAIAANIPLGRLGEPADIGGAVVFLLSPAASWITGQVLVVAGGL